ncbi:DUF4440 domain-containing protein [Winogradskyella sp. 3972H.M.0a.05]|uniref:YybH family protein n=1 Tax=Winogradskyella sp. 3972H.M.0a.05 TaxID=2950277 RepID=UPI003398D4EA
MKIDRIFSNIFLSLFILCLCVGCNKEQSKESIDKEEQAIIQVHKDYVDGWLQMDEDKILNLLEEDARIQPSGLSPVEGKSEIQKFWFPKDSSVTTVHDFQTEIISLKVLDTLAISTHNSILDWTYQKDTIRFGMLQKGINTTIYKKQSDDSWKIWRSMWTDFYFENK